MAAPLILKYHIDHQQDPNPTRLFSSIQEAKSIAKISLPIILTGLLLYSRSMISMLFLGRLNDLPALSGGSLALGFAVFIAYKALVKKQFQAHITTLYSDNGGKYIALRSFLTENGIAHLTTPPHTPEHNGLSERKHIHVVETGMTLLSQAGVPKHYWPYAFATAVFLINQMPTSTLAMETPFQKLFAKPPNYSNLKVFGCLCFPWHPPLSQYINWPIGFLETCSIR